MFTWFKFRRTQRRIRHIVTDTTNRTDRIRPYTQDALALFTLSVAECATTMSIEAAVLQDAWDARMRPRNMIYHELMSVERSFRAKVSERYLVFLEARKKAFGYTSTPKAATSLQGKVVGVQSE